MCAIHPLEAFCLQGGHIAPSLARGPLISAKINIKIPQFLRNLSLFGITVLAKAITRHILANSIAFYSFSSVFFFQSVKLDYAMTLNEQKFAKISIREIPYRY